MKKNLVFIFSIFITISSFAQDIVGGEFSIGPRIVGSAGLSFKFHNKSNLPAFELISAQSFDNKIYGFTIGAMFEKIAPINRFCFLSMSKVNIMVSMALLLPYISSIEKNNVPL
ncbi:MAG: hypothetical protein WCO37_03555 [Bacteroidota bacterium]|jgi:hypothetical protein